MVTNAATGLTKDAYRVDLVAVLNEFDDRSYVRYVKPGARMGLIFKGIDSDRWSDEMNHGRGATSAPGHSFTFNSPGRGGSDGGACHGKHDPGVGGRGQG